MVLVWYTGGYKQQRLFENLNYDQVVSIARGLLPVSAIWRIESI